MQGDFSGDSINQTEESAEEVISSIMLEEEPIVAQQIVDLDIKNEATEESTLQTFESTQVNPEVMKIESREREERLREISIKLRTPSGLTKLEDEPAYKRNNIDLEETAHSSEDEMSHFSLTSDNEDKIILNDRNSFLHDNVD